jgi:YD repeat-containing protein
VGDPCQLLDFQNAQLAAPRYEYGYDPQGNHTLIRDPLGRETHFTFDDQGSQLSRTLPLGVESPQSGESPLAAGDESASKSQMV